MLANNRGQLAGWEALIIIVLLGSCAGLGYLYAKKPSENSIYQSGSKPHVEDVRMAPFSCIREGALDAIGNKAVSHS